MSRRTGAVLVGPSFGVARSAPALAGPRQWRQAIAVPPTDDGDRPAGRGARA
jgi:hypothetical protein